MAEPVTLVAPIRWARDFGYLEIFDATARVWHQVPAAAVPRWWAQAAMEAKKGARS